MKLFLQDCEFAKGASKFERGFLAAVSAIMIACVTVAVVLIAAQFLPWLAHLLENRISNIQFGKTLVIVSLSSLVIAGVIIWKS